MKMVANMKVIGNIVKDMVGVNIITKMVQFIMVISKMIISMVMDYNFVLMVQNLKENGDWELERERVRKYIQMVLHIRENILMIIRMDLVFIKIQKGMFIGVIGKMENKVVKGKLHIKMEIIMMENG